MRSLVIIVSALFVLNVEGSSFSWGSSKPRDCEWGEWQGTMCEHKGNRVFRVRQTRKKFAAENGGADCVGSSVREIPCKELEYIASSFFETISTATTSARISKPSGWWSSSVFKGIKAVTKCVKPYYDASGGLRIAGRCDKSRRRRSSVEEPDFDEMDFGEEPEKTFRKKRSNDRKEKILTKKNRDVLFLLDESGSVNSGNFKKEMRMATTIVSKFCDNIDVAKGQTRVAVMTFDKKQHVHFNFDKYFQKHIVVREMNKIQYKSATDGDTCLVDALNFVRKDMFTIERGARLLEKDAERMVIFITDGCANCEDDSAIEKQLKGLRKKLEQQGIAFLSFFIGETDDCVKKMNELSEGSRCHEAWRAKNWAEFDSMTDHIAKTTCMSAWTKGQPCPEE